MNWDDTGFLISKLKYNENSVIADFFSKDHGRTSGIIFGASSKKIKGYLQIGNKFHINCNFKNDSKIGAIKPEILSPNAPFYFNERKKLHSIISAMSMVKLLTAENQKNEKIYELIENFFYILNKDDWIKSYLFWELELLKLLGYDLNLSKIVKKSKIDNGYEYYVESSIEKKIVPNFLIENQTNNFDYKELIKGYNLVTNYLEKNIFIPNNISQPFQRLDFINLLK